SCPNPLGCLPRLSRAILLSEFLVRAVEWAGALVLFEGFSSWVGEEPLFQQIEGRAEDLSKWFLPVSRPVRHGYSEYAAGNTGEQIWTKVVLWVKSEPFGNRLCEGAF